ncbi:TRAP transporter large permease [Brevibacillus porteri]|uniref:C4-dicarboxylate ABC transporter permease n=1 Tax=Brevibacillus porteri TaxID=2126350 RepID=A0ABX5FV94_9BACL|nr:TRAP transporter large permease [Brevibacillus porteri]MED1799708.1 TRAP transporter large permease [Brevibacillus porteri]MED2131103.1 TRAP transporter large permease [Brevibacillus porteri]MED2747113.1 TRAP transporter large permease [Brevibacillus porteri]MED2816551.1 TRAP transporter large permease [Brevibacillus porteri]MED2894179.1 TRAP transporter large permease [Brevibacillus porteri]
MGTILFLTLLVLLILNVPIGVALGLSVVVVFMLEGNIPLLVVIQKMFNGTDSFPLMAIPFFLLAGKLMETGGISARLIRFANTIVGNLPGGLAIVAVMGCTFFAAISGSSAATTAAVGGILIPHMVKKGYNIRFSAALHATGGTIGVMIPPSVPMVLYGVAASASISDLFIAGIGPGILVAISLILYSYWISKKNGWGGGEKHTPKEIGEAFKDAILAILMPIIILGGIYGAIFTPTEAAVVAVIYGLVVGLFVYREIKWKDLGEIFAGSASMTAVIMLIIATANAFGYLMTRENIPQEIAQFMLGITDSTIITLLIINILLLILGTFMETAVTIILLTPILLPITNSLGIDPVLFGVIMVVNSAIGMLTPPVGINLLVAGNIAKLQNTEIERAVIPFLVIMIVDLMLITYIPEISLFLVNLSK